MICLHVQLCQAHRNEAQKHVIVVMSRRPKLEMEETYRTIIPEADRLGTRFVFRQGSPLVPDNLRRVAATTASSLIVIGDSSRSALAPKEVKLSLLVADCEPGQPPGSVCDILCRVAALSAFLREC